MLTVKHKHSGPEKKKEIIKTLNLKTLAWAIEAHQSTEHNRYITWFYFDGFCLIKCSRKAGTTRDVLMIQQIHVDHKLSVNIFAEEKQLYPVDEFIY